MTTADQTSAANPATPIRVVLAEDSVLLRDGLVRLLTAGGFQVVAAVDNAEALLAAVEHERPDLVIVDVRMPPTYTAEGINAALVLRATYPDLAILILSQYVEETYAADLLARSAHGVGYLLKDRVADTDEFLTALRQVHAGGTVLDPEVVSQVLLRARSADPLETLTPREREVLALMAEGKSNADIAAALVVSDGAVEKHISSIFAKLGLNPQDGGHRRVLAVLTYLGLTTGTEQDQ